MIAFQVALQGFQAVSWRGTQIIEFVSRIEHIHFSESSTHNALRKPPGAGSVSAMIQICGGGVAKGTNAHQKDYNAFTVSMQDGNGYLVLRQSPDACAGNESDAIALN